MEFKKINTREKDLMNNKTTPLVWCNGVCSCWCVCFTSNKVAKAATGWGSNAVVNAAKSAGCW